MMYDHEKSDLAIVAVKPTNKAGQPAAELVEPRAGAEGNVSQQSTGRAQYRGTVSQALRRIRQAARQRKKEKFTALFHHVSIDHLADAFSELKENAAARGGKPQAARARQTGDLHLPGLHLYLRKNSSGQIPNQTEVPAGSHAGKVASHQTGIATELASADSPKGKMVAAGRHRLLQLPRGVGQQFEPYPRPIPPHQSPAAHATAAEPERLDDLGAD